MKAYEPQPGTIPFRVIEYFKMQPPGTEVETAVLAEAIGHDGTPLAALLAHPVERGALLSTKRPGIRSVFWSLGSGNKRPKDLPLNTNSSKSEPVTSRMLDPLGWRGMKQEPEDTKAAFEGFELRCSHGTLLGDGPCARCTGKEAKAKKTDNPQPEASTEAAQVDGKEASEGHAEERPRMDAEFERMLSGRRPVARIALFDDDTLHIDGHVIAPDRVRALVRYFDRMNVDHLREEVV